MIEINKQLENFIKNLQDRNFYDAHEDLEVIWFVRRFEDCDEVRLLKGFINASVSFELFKKGKIDASNRVWKNYIKYKYLINHVNTIHLVQYRLVIQEIEKVKKNL